MELGRPAGHQPADTLAGAVDENRRWLDEVFGVVFGNVFTLQLGKPERHQPADMLAGATTYTITCWLCEARFVVCCCSWACLREINQQIHLQVGRQLMLYDITCCALVWRAPHTV
jgi:hypothetical protein